MVENRISKKDWQECAGNAVRLPCVQIAQLQSEAHVLRASSNPASSDFEVLKQSVDRVLGVCQAVQMWNHDKSRDYQGLPCDNLRMKMRLKI